MGPSPAGLVFRWPTRYRFRVRYQVFRWGMSLSTAMLFTQCGPSPVRDVQRAEFANWLRTADVSPYAAVYHQPFSGRLVVGPSVDPPLSGLPAAVLEQGTLRLTLESGDATRTVPRNRPVALGGWFLRITGDRRSSFVTIFSARYDANPPGWFAVDSSFVVDGVLEPPANVSVRRMLGLDGVTIEASHAGVFVATMTGEDVRLTVYRMPESGSEEQELSIFFRDPTNGNGTYTAGRFLTLRPLGDGGYVADFNRARNPFCAYNPVYPCPLPWPGNQIDAPVLAGERYNGGGLETSG